jgi:hypothetical protein
LDVLASGIIFLSRAKSENILFVGPGFAPDLKLSGSFGSLQILIGIELKVVEV